MAKTVFVVEAKDSYEPGYLTKAFATKAGAEKFRESMLDYDLTPPKEPPESKDEAAWNRWYDRKQRWRRKHPGGEHAAQSDEYRIHELDLLP
jgi:hypothetical protein